MGAFDRYAPFVQEYIYRNHWENLRAIQVAAADAIFNTEDHVLLTASTASGKTEAAFFPIITLFSENPPASVGCIYIGPLKALINDQFLRLNELCAEADIPVWHWHGDVPQSHKEKLMKHPSGILQITPESLEALLLHKHAAIPRLFSDLRFVVIDEVHSLLRGDRGGQTLCLIERLSRLAGVNPRRIGLSATIGDPEGTGAFLAAGTGRKTYIPKIDAKGIKWRLSMEHFYVKDVQAAEDRTDISAMEVLDEKTDDAPENADPGIGYIFEHTRGKKCLVFVNSREECETVTTTLRGYCERNREPDRFLIHHGNLSASVRETAEGIMKDDSQAMTTVTTATLELGIDIGRLERAFQIDAPWTVSSFLQRMGRTGRRGTPPEMWFVIREDEPEIRAMLPSTIPWKLLQGIALVQLYLEQRWVEHPRLLWGAVPRGTGGPGAAPELFPPDRTGGLQNSSAAPDRHGPHPAHGSGRADRRSGGRTGHQLLQILRCLSGERGIYRPLRFSGAGHRGTAPTGGRKACHRRTRLAGAGCRRKAAHGIL